MKAEAISNSAVFFLLLASTAWAQPPCSEALSENTQRELIQKLKKKKIIHASEEIKLESIGLEYRWEVLGLKVVNGECFGLVKLSPFDLKTSKKVEEGKEFHSFLVSKGEVAQATEAKQVPAKLRIGIGDRSPSFVEENGKMVALPHLGKDLYYVELSDRKSIVDALLAMYFELPTPGFMGLVIPGGKAEFDPTEGRAWRVINGTYDMHRGSTAEVLDLRAGHFDSDFQAYFRGANTAEVSWNGRKVTAAQVGPWDSSYVRSVQISDGSWLPVLEEEGPRIGQPRKISLDSYCSKLLVR